MPTTKSQRLLEKLKTRSVKGVELLDVGTWNASTGEWDVDDETIARILANFDELSDVISAPLKLGHDDDQLLLQTDGYPAAGWIKRLYREGKKLVADFERIPEKIADMIEAGLYRKCSVEVWPTFTIDGKAYTDVLTAVALLGADLPAVSTLDDFIELCGAKKPVTLSAGVKPRVVIVDAPKRRAELGEGTSVDDLRSAIDAALREKYGDGLSGYAWPWIEEMFADYVIATRDGRHWQVPFTKGSDGSVSLGAGVEVTQTWKPIATPETSAGNPGEKEKAGMADMKAIAAALGLADNATEAQIVEAIGKRNASQPRKATKAECDEKGGKWNETDGTCEMPAEASLRAEVTELRTNLARRDAKDAVDAAIRAKKLAPAQRAWAEDYATADPKGFAAYVDKTPADLFEASKGSEGDAPETDDDPVAKFNAKVAEKLKADKDIDIGEAQSQVAREEPELVRAAYGR